MAELLGIASGVAGLASLSIQLLQTAQTLRGFYRDAKDAPDLLNNLSLDLEIMGLMLVELERHRGKGEERMDVLLASCLARFEQEIRKFKVQVESFGQRFKRSKLRARIIVAFRDPEIQKDLMDLERAKNSLWIVYQMCIECQRAQRASQDQKDIITHLDQIRMSVSSPQPGRDSETNQRDMRLIPQSNTSSVFQDDIEESRSVGHNSLVKSYDSSLHTSIQRVRPKKRVMSWSTPQWLSGRVYTFMVSRVGWDVNLNLRTWVYCEDRTAFHYAMDGDLPGLRKLLTNGKIGLRDRDLGNFSLLETAANYRQAAICDFLLLQCGLAADVEATNGALTVLGFNGHNWTDDMVQYEEMFRRVIDRSSSECDVDETHPEVRDIPRCWLACPDIATLQLILEKQTIFEKGAKIFSPGELFELNHIHETRLEYIVTNPDVLLYLFGIESSELHRLHPSIRHLLLDLAVQRIGVLAGERGDPQDRTSIHCYNLWLNLIKYLILAGTSANHEDDYTTPLLRLLRAYLQSRSVGWYSELVQWRVLDLWYCLQHWVEVLNNACVDLYSYGERESQAWARASAHLQNKSVQCKSTPSPLLGCKFLLVENFTYGPNPSDWSLNVRLVKTLSVWQEHTLPGSWRFKSWIPTGQLHQNGCRNVPSNCTKVEGVGVSSNSLDIRALHECLNEKQRSSETVVGGVQDDSGPVALTVLYHRLYAGRLGRARSQTVNGSSRETRAYSGGIWQPSWLPYYRPPCVPAIGASQHFVGRGYYSPCPCTTRQLPESYQYQPRWIRACGFGEADAYDIDGTQHCSIDLQETDRWNKYSFLGQKNKWKRS